MKFQISALISSCAVSAAVNSSVQENAPNELSALSGSSRDNLEAIDLSMDYSSAATDSFVPNKIMRARREEEAARLGKALRNTYGSDAFGSQGIIDTRRDEVDKDIGILGNDEPSNDASRHLQEVPIPEWNPSIDCNEYCSQFGERPYISPTVVGAFPTPGFTDYPLQYQVDQYLKGLGPYTSVPINCWNTSQITDMRQAFYVKKDGFCRGGSAGSRQCEFNKPLGCWDTSSVTKMTQMFHHAEKFNQPIDSWNVSSVTGFTRMFTNTVDFNQCLSTWAEKTIDQVNTHTIMFFNAFGCAKRYTPRFGSWCQEDDVCTPSFLPENGEWNPSIDCDTYCSQFGERPLIEETNGDFRSILEASRGGDNTYDGPINCWNTSLVTNMRYAFGTTNDPPSIFFTGRDTFNAPLGCWDTSSVTDMSFMFQKTYFTQEIKTWDTSSVTNMAYMFRTSNFNKPIDSWDTSSVEDMRGMFDSSYFNQEIKTWDTSSVTNMASMFRASNFNKPIDSWVTSAVTDMSYMFYGSAFDSSIASFDTSAVTSMRSMFEGFSSFPKKFNQPVDFFDTSSVNDMSSMFKNSRNFNQPVDAFNTAKVTTMESMFENAEAFNQCISTWADETPSDVITTNMFVISGCPIQTDPNPSVGPWCQPPDSESGTTCKEYTPIPTQSPTPRRTIPPTAQGPECNDQLKSETRFQFRKNKRYNCEKLEEFFEGKSDTLKKRTCKKTTTTAKGEEATISTFCPRTCGICPDQCKDSRKKFLVTERKITKKRNCKFYYRTVFGQKRACRANVELLNGKKRKMFILCPKFCAGFGLGVCAPAANPEPPYVSNSF